MRFLIIAREYIFSNWCTKMTLAYYHIIFMLSNTASFFLAFQIDTRRTCFIDRSKWREVVGSFSEKAMAPHSSTLAWKIPWTEEPARLQSMGSLGVGHDWATSLSLFTFMHWRRKWQPNPVFLPGESLGRGSLVGCRLWGHTSHDWSDLAAAAAGSF